MIKIVFIKDKRSLLVICESEGYCNRLINDPKFRFNVTFISGKGNPDDATLLFLKFYGPRFIKCLCFTDVDEFGLFIYGTYKRYLPSIQYTLVKKSDK